MHARVIFRWYVIWDARRTKLYGFRVVERNGRGGEGCVLESQSDTQNQNGGRLNRPEFVPRGNHCVDPEFSMGKMDYIVMVVFETQLTSTKTGGFWSVENCHEPLWKLHRHVTVRMSKGGRPLDISKGIFWCLIFFPQKRISSLQGLHGIGTEGKRSGWSLIRVNLIVRLSPKLANNRACPKLTFA